ncbi:MAG: hypothetical protein PHT92_05310 [Bacteroidales bacterium]|nr:hypothetical protein [Bacteroidales bacterium]
MRDITKVLLLGLILNSSVGLSQISDQYQIVDSVENLTANFVRANPANRMFMHFDKAEYCVGESLWFKAYLFDGYINVLDSIPANLYVNLYDFNGRAVSQYLFKVEKGVASGEVWLDNDLPDGNYFIKAYTDIMANGFWEDYFVYSFYIRNPDYANRISRKEIRLNKSFNEELDRRKGQVSIEVKAESGNLIAGIENRLVVKSTNGIGEYINGSGKLVCSSGAVVAEFSTSKYGLGSLVFIPEIDKTYHVEFESSGSGVALALPEVLPNGVGIRIQPSYSDSLGISFYSTFQDCNEMILVVRMGARLLYHKKLKINPYMWKDVSLSQSDLETGVAVVELYSKGLSLVSQRPIYINKNDQTYLVPATHLMDMDDHKVMLLTLETTDSNAQPVQSDMSISVTTSSERSINSNDIYRHLFITSYFTNLESIPPDLLAIDNDKMLEQLDMLIQFGSYKVPSYSELNMYNNGNNIPQRRFGATVTGFVLDPYTNQPVSNVGVELKRSFGDQRVYKAKTNESGVFTFEGVNISDSARVEITPSLISGGVRPNIELVEDDMPATSYYFSENTRYQEIIKRGSNWKRSKSSAPRPPVSVSPYGRPDQTIFINTRDAHRTVFEVLQEKAIGLIISGNTIMFRGPSSILYSNEPLFIRDDVVVSADEFLSQDPRDIARIELFRGASAAFWGARGGNGVILSYGRRGEAPAKPYFEFVIQGFTSPSEFSIDPVEVSEKQSLRIQQTVLWDPDIWTSGKGATSVSFLIIPGISPYIINVVGVSVDGKIVMGNFSIGR